MRAAHAPGVSWALFNIIYIMRTRPDPSFTSRTWASVWTIARGLCYTSPPLRHGHPISLALLLAMAGCVAAPPAAPPQATDAPDAPAAAPAPPANRPVAAAPAGPQAPAPTDAAAPAAISTAPSSAPSPSASPPAQTARVDVQATARTKPPAAVKPAAPAPQPAARPAQQAPPAAPALDVAALEQRLRDTRAIGLFTKLSLKNQVDDLLDAFRAHHRSQNSAPLTALRQRYDLLMLKVLTLLQDGDPPLATAINSSREAIWGLLNDPAKLTAI